MATTAKAKGAIVRPMVEWFAGACGEAALANVVADLSPDVRSEVSLDSPALGILPAGWYTESLASQLAEGVVRHAIGQFTETVVLRELGTRIIDRTLGRLSRAAVEWLATPATVAAAAPIFWRMYHDSGKVEGRLDGSSMVATSRDWALHSAMWCKVVGASCLRVLELARCRDARIWVHKCSGGRGECTLVFRWRGTDLPPSA
jgi:hypothetical protein